MNDRINEMGNQADIIKQSVSPAFIKNMHQQGIAHQDEYQSLISALNKNKHEAEKKGGKPADGAILFISFSMPEDTILALASEAQSYGIPVVLKGLLDGDFQKTLQKIMQLHEKAKKMGGSFSGFSIDPIWFEQFEINTVPALVVTRRPSWCLYQKACASQPYDMVLGNVHIKKSLGVIAEQGESVPEVARMILENHHV